MIRKYSELITLENFIDRFEYLKLNGIVGQETFGFDRYLNQLLYQSRRWRIARDAIIIRDEGCDLAHLDYPIHSTIIVHHLNPITQDDIESGADVVFDPEGLVCVSLQTHNALHYSDQSLLPKSVITRSQGDTCPWR